MKSRRETFANRKKKFLFRTGAVLLGLLPFLLFELVLYGIGWQQPGSVGDPFVGFTEIQPLFELNDTSRKYEVSDSRFPLFCPDSFPADKPDDEYRIFCVGGSTVQGRPFAIETSFTKWLELSLQASDPTRNWNVINCGGVSYASYRLAPIVEEIVEYQPDLIILYTGHNEFLEDRTYESVKTTSPWVVRTHQRLSTFKTYSFLRNRFVGAGPSSPGAVQQSAMPVEVEARLDFRDGLKKYTRDDPWKLDVVRHFEHNLRRMVQTSQSAGVPIVLCKPVANLRDAAPFKSENDDSLTESESRQFAEYWDQLVREAESPAGAQREREILESLVAVDSRHAELHFRLGQSYLASGEVELAKAHLIRAKEEDVCPLRIIEPMYDVLDRVSLDFGVPMIDVKTLFENRAKDGIPGRESLVDHVHPSIHGHQLIAATITDELIQLGWIDVPPIPSQEREALFKAHLESLPFMYFQRGKERLAGLKRWAEGKVTRERASQDN